jgi:hypothetical protein
MENNNTTTLDNMVKQESENIFDLVKNELSKIEKSKVVRRLGDNFEMEVIIKNNNFNKTKSAKIILEDLSKEMMDELILHTIYKLIQETQE